MGTVQNTRLAWRRAAFALAALAASCAAYALDVTLPPERASFRDSGLPGYKLVLQNCMACHSAHYVQMQPSTSSRAYWEATVKKMKKPFDAPFPAEDIPAMVDYLVKTYGAERTATASATVK